MKNDSYADRLERGFDVQLDGDRRRNDTVNFVAGEIMLQSQVDVVREMAKERDALKADSVLIAQLVEAMETVLTISDRKHDAWDAAKAAIAAYRAAPQPRESAAVSAKPPWTTCPDCGYDIARASAKPLRKADRND